MHSSAAAVPASYFMSNGVEIKGWLFFFQRPPVSPLMASVRRLDVVQNNCTSLKHSSGWPVSRNEKKNQMSACFQRY